MADDLKSSPEWVIKAALQRDINTGAIDLLIECSRRIADLDRRLNSLQKRIEVYRAAEIVREGDETAAS